MLTFRYRARNTRTGKIEKGTVNGSSEAVAARLLMAQGIVPLSMESTDEKGIFSKFNTHVSTKEVVIFTRQLSTMLNAGLPLSQSLASVQDQTSNKYLKTVIAELLTSIQSGQPLSDSIEKYPKLFNNVYVALVRAGETSGTLDKSLLRLADQQEHDADQLSKIRNAMIYPVIVLIVIIAVMVFMMVTLIPQVASLYDDLGKTLPVTTQILMNIVDFFGKWWFIVIAVLGGGIFGLKTWFATKQGRHVWDMMKLNVPLFNPLLRKLYMARFSRTAQVLMQSGVSMMETLRIAADATNNSEVRAEILQGVGKVKNGKSLSESLSGQDYILTFVPQMIKIGEQSGNIDAMLGKVADYYDKEVDNAIAAISTLIEPILMVVMAFMIGFIVLAVLLPIYGLTDTSSL